MDLHITDFKCSGLKNTDKIPNSTLTLLSATASVACSSLSVVNYCT